MQRPPRPRGGEGKSFPVRLCEVLEQEFVVLHGPLPEAPDWRLDESDVCLDQLVDRLGAAPPGSTCTAIGALRRRLEQAGVRIPAPGAASTDDARALLQHLNRLIEADEDLFPIGLLDRHAEPCRLARGRPRSAAAPMARDERMQLNRLMLEAAFPAQIVARCDTVRLSRLFQAIHGLRRRGGMRSALCLSGGGIRSAAFSLGVLQVLARRDLLPRFDYLSTVSGGGYVGSWLSTWIHRHPEGVQGVSRELGARTRNEAAAWSAKLDPAPWPIEFLRSYSRFLNPRAGLFSLDNWTWIGTYLRNLGLNWLAAIPLLMLVAALPRLYVAFVRAAEQSASAVEPAWFWLATAAGVCTVVCATVNRPSATDATAGNTDPSCAPSRRVLSRLPARFKRQGWILALGVAPLLAFATLLTRLLWAVPAGTSALAPRQTLALLTGTPLVDLMPILPNLGLGAIVLWGEAIVLAGWIVSTALVSGLDWRRRLLELAVMLIAGLLTWLLVAAFADVALAALAFKNKALPLGPLVLHPIHVYVLLAVPAIVLAVLAGMTLFIGIMSKCTWIEDEDREWWARFGAWGLVAIFGWTVLAAVAVLGPPLLFEWPRLAVAIGSLSGLLAVLLGRSGLTPGKAGQADDGTQDWKSILAATGINLVPWAAGAFLAVFLAALSLLSGGLLLMRGEPLATVGRLMGVADPGPMHRQCGFGEAMPPAEPLDVFIDRQIGLEVFCQTPPGWLVAAALWLVACLAVAGLAINLNKFSLHATYRIRIIRTFLGASRGTERRPNPFTGFDPLDNVQMHELQPGLLGEADLCDLDGWVSELARSPGHPADQTRLVAAGALVHLLCASRHDPFGVLRARLDEYRRTRQVSKALQRDLIENVNRVLETERLDRLAPFTDLLGRPFAQKTVGHAVGRFLAQGNLILSNRLLLQQSFEPYLRPCAYPPTHKLLHVLNLTINLVSGRRLAWQERKAAPFSVSPMHSGSYYLGYRESRDYGGKDGISIGTAAAISGAAVSPNMGYSSSTLTALVLALFNMRLGWWLGNPGAAGTHTYRRAEPRFAMRSLLAEALGMTDDEQPYVYLSDGGHFENLGLFEMVLRRCLLVVAIDASADPSYQFKDLGNAVRKVRIDLGISIDFDDMPIHAPHTPPDPHARYCAIGRIGYAAVDGPGAVDGVLIYFKPVLCGGESRDVRHYADRHKRFPQEPISKQFFSESHFESYRRLGEQAMETACGPQTDRSDGSWADGLVRAVRSYLGKPAAPDGNGSTASPDWLHRWLEGA